LVEEPDWDQPDWDGHVVPEDWELDEWIRIWSKRAIMRRRRPALNSYQSITRVAAREAAKLCERCRIPITVSKNSVFVRIATALFNGHEREDSWKLYDPCREEYGRRRVAASLSGGTGRP
jgi:hypothetical protein